MIGTFLCAWFLWLIAYFEKYLRKTLAVKAEFKMVGDVETESDDGVLIYVDGACRNNGQSEAKGGCGVYWDDYHPLNCSEVLLGEKQTNNRAEMSAAIIALSQAIAIGLTNITIISDSRYMKEGISNWIKKWKVNGWKTQTKTDILNKDLWVLLDGLRTKVNVTWKWVEGHGTIEGNIEADRLAGIGVSESSCYWQECAMGPGLDTVNKVSNAEPAGIVVSQPPRQEEKARLCSFCNKDSPGKTIQCSECKSTCHYGCTRLPRYQLYALHNTHRKYTCELCLTIPATFANDIEDEVSLRTAVPEEKPILEKSHDISENHKKFFNESMSKNTEMMRELLQTFQSTTVHVLESAFVNAIEKLGSTDVSSKESEMQSQIQHLLQEKDRLLKEKENLIREVKSSRTDAVHAVPNQETQNDLLRLTKEREDIQMNLHKTTTELEILKSKLETETSVWRQKLDAMTSRNDILSNESVQLEKMLSLKNEDISELENSKRELKKQIEILQSEILSLKLHESRADDTLIQTETTEALDTSVVIVDGSGASQEKSSYSKILGTDNSKKKNSTRPTTQQSNTSLRIRNADEQENTTNNNDSSRNEQASSQIQSERKDKVILIGTSNVRYLSSRYIAGNSYYVHKEIKYTVGEAKAYVDSLAGNDSVSKFILHLSCNDIKSVSAESHASSYCDLVRQIHDKYPEARVIVSLGLPRKDKLLSNKVEVSNGMIKEKLFSDEKTTICNNSNLAFRGTPVYGVLEDDGVHITRKGVYILNNNFRFCLYGSSNGTISGKPREYSNGHRGMQQNGMVYGHRRFTSQRRFGDSRPARR